MVPLSAMQRALHDVLARADHERERAVRAAQYAQRHEELAAGPEPLLELHTRMAATHRRTERRHLAAVRMHGAYADRLRAWIDLAGREPGEGGELGPGAAAGKQARLGVGSDLVLPSLMAAVAETAEADSAAVTLFGPDRMETLVVASDACAKAAQDLEFTLGQGPAREALTAPGPVLASGDALSEQWPAYGPAVMRLGIRSLAAVPVEVTGVRLGVLTVFEPRERSSGPLGSGSLEQVRAVADSLAALVFLEPGPPGLDRNAARYSFFTQADHRSLVYQAAGVVCAQVGCTPGDAIDLLRARAFADGRSIDEVAGDVVEHRLYLR